MPAADPPFPGPSPSYVAHWVSRAGSGHLEEVGAWEDLAACPSCRTGDGRGAGRVEVLIAG